MTRWEIGGEIYEEGGNCNDFFKKNCILNIIFGSNNTRFYIYTYFILSSRIRINVLNYRFCQRFFR